MRITRYIVSLLFITTLAVFIFQVPFSRGKSVDAGSFRYYPLNIAINPPDSNPRFPIPNKTEPFNGNNSNHPLYLNNPSNVDDSVVFDPISNEYIFKSKMGDMDYNTPNTMTFEEYQKYDMDRALQGYWRERSKAANAGNRGGLIPQLKVGGEVFDKIFGSNTIDIRPQGSAELIFGIIGNKREDPSLDIRQRSTTNFDFQEKIQMSVVAKIGDKIEFKTNYNTESMFSFENKLKLRYEGKEDEILQLLEAGDVNLPLNTTLIQGSQSLFGLKTKLKFGRTTVTGVFSEQKGETKNITVQGGAETNTFNFKADQYEENRHFFLTQYFRNNYNNALSTLPIIASNVNITKIEVWRTNIGAPTTNNRNIVAFTDLGENKPSNTTINGHIGVLPNNISNDLLDQLQDTGKLQNINLVGDYLKNPPFNLISGQDFEKVESAKRLAPTEFTYNSKLGFISLNTSINSDQVLAVAFQYTIIGDSTVYQVGQFSDQGISDPKALVVKLIKSSSLNTRGPLWKLMMKNVYSLGAYQVNKQDFRMNILYSGDQGGVPTGYFNDGPKKGIALIRLLHLDTLDAQMNPTADGVFDFIENAATAGGTIQATNGRIYFPLVEPFGKDLRAILNDTVFSTKYCYDSLYTLTKTEAQQYPDKNKFILEGFYKSASGSEISLGGFNIPQGSVKVTSGGIPLTENVDFTVDYTLGRVRIINEGILNSGAPINISTESNSMFNIMTKRMMGMHVNYEVNKDFNIGGTIMNLHQSPLTQKVNYGDEPISNTIWGIDFDYQTESRFLTKMIDKLPFIQTKTPSKINFYGEFAHFIPGHSSAIGSTGTSYIDDFEGSKSSIDMKNYGNWFIASTPQGQTQGGFFPEGATDSKLAYGFNRAKLAWYVIDPSIFYRSDSKPPNVSKNDISLPYAREVYETEVFPNKELPSGTPTNISVLNLAYYPTEKGPYNYDVAGLTGISSGINTDGTLKSPETRWAGIMRKIESTDFEATNVEYIEFWMMDPFIGTDGQGGNPLHTGGQLYFNLGDISEDILRDGRKSFENGLPTSAVATNVDTTIWGRVPKLQALVNSFDNNPSSREFQDVGYDGLKSVDEVSFFDTEYISKIVTLFGTTSQAYLQASIDPSNDNYHYFRGSDYDQVPLYSNVNERYKNFNGPDGNSPTADQSPETYPTNATTMPNVEDINIDNTLSESENYYQYMIDLKPGKMEVGQNYITDVHLAQGIRLPNGATTNTKWYQFKIPVRTPDKTVGKIQNFQSIRFMRMFLKGFSQNIICRFATLELVRGEWRKYSNQLLTPGDYTPIDQSNTVFNVSAVNIEENGKRIPVPYVIPPGIEREINNTTTNLQKLNEQSLSMRVLNLSDGDARAIYKTTDFDFRRFKNLKMYIHGEKAKVNEELNFGDLKVFVRLGSDFTQNFYEIELPIAFTPWGVGSTDANQIWPVFNEMIINLEKLVSVKEHRNQIIRSGNNNVNYSSYYSENEGAYKYTVLGSPSISDVNTIMIGVRNPKKQNLSDNDDMLPKSAEIWINELRLTDFNDKSGWAATARVRANLADLGDVSLSGAHSTDGFGSIEKKINETQKEDITSYDIATNLELGKFFPEKTGLKIPMHYDYSKSISNPEYNPLDPDIKLENDLASYQNEAQRDSIKQLVQDYTTRKNINFMNVRKEKTGNSITNRIYDVENLDVSYSYSEIYRRNIDIEYDIKKVYRGGLGYNYTNNPKTVKPFERIGFINKYKAFTLIKDFNFYYAPKLMSFRTEMNREYNENKLRNKSAGLIILEPTFFKKFEWNRIYGFKFDLATSLQFEYNATANANIDEPQGKIDTKEKSDSIWENIMNFGRIQHYTQNINLNYNIPINKIPGLEWVSAQARYGADYKWEGTPVSLKRLGNSIENNNTKQINGSLNLTTLYNKIHYLQKITQKSQSSQRSPMMPGRGRPNQKQEMQAPLPEEDTVPKKTNYFVEVANGILQFVTGFKTASISFTENNGTFFPGFIPEPVALGNNWSQNAPGMGFILGSQVDLRQKAIDNSWISKDTLQNNAYLNKYTNSLNARASFEPISDFKIEFTANRTFSENHSEYFKANADGGFKSSTPTTTGSFSISYMTISTAFIGDNEDNSNETFNKFLEYRAVIASRLSKSNPNSYNQAAVFDTISKQYFPYGYGSTSQEVLIPAFLAAYSGRDPGGINLNPFPKIPIPNWTLNYTGLSKLKVFKKTFRTITISNAYRSSYSVGSYATNILYKPDDNGFQYIRNNTGNFITDKQIDQITLTEQFSPLLKIELAWVNSLLTNIEFKKSRNLSLSFVNNQLTELISNEYIFGLGYRFKDVTLSFLTGSGKSKEYKSDINVKCDFSIRSNKTVLRRVDQNINQISTGQQVISLNLSADYQLNERFTLRAFFDKVINNPYISSTFPNSTTNAGLSVRFSLAQ